MPTIWIGQRYIEMLPLYEENPLIGEVIIIDNDTSNFDEDVLKYSKVVYVPMQDNIYVNPAWNLGAKMAKYDILCFANDDISVDLRFLDKALEYLTSENGMLGMYERVFKDTKAESINQVKDLEDRSIIRPAAKMDGRYANFFLTHKESYHHIPDELKIHYGDVYLFEKNIKMNKQNYEMADGYAIAILGSSSNFFKEITKKDREFYKTITL